MISRCDILKMPWFFKVPEGVHYLKSDLYEGLGMINLRELIESGWAMKTTGDNLVDPELAACLEAVLTDKISLLKQAWNLIFNVCGGNWASQSMEWRKAAEAFREEYHGIDSTIKDAKPSNEFFHGPLGEAWLPGHLLIKFDKPITVSKDDMLNITYTVPQDFEIEDAEELFIPANLCPDGFQPLTENLVLGEFNMRPFDGKIKELSVRPTGNHMLSYGPVDPSIDCRCLGCKIEATASKDNLYNAGWSDIEANPNIPAGQNKYVGICMRDACRTKFGLPTIQNSYSDIIGGGM